jgi:hypothetical protein
MSTAACKPPEPSESETAEQIRARSEQAQIDFEMSRSRHLKARADQLARMQARWRERHGGGSPGP